MRLLLLTILLFINSISFSQQNTINLKSGQHEIEYNFDILNQNEKYYRYVLFSEIPSTEQITQLKDIGINLLEYLPKNMYICSIDKYILPTQLEKFNVISLNKILPSFKIDKKLKNNYPDWAYKNGELSLKLILHKDANYDESLKFVQSKYEKVQFNDKSSRIFVTIDESDLLDLASFEFISFIEPIDPPSLPENKTGRTLHRSNTVNVDYNSSISRKYNGDGVKVMMQDDGIVGPHIDRQGRLDHASRDIYPFYESYDTTLNFISDSILSLVPTTKYKQNLNFYSEDFDGLGNNFDISINSDTNFISPFPTDSVYGKISNVGKVILQNPFLNFEATTFEIDDFPSGGSPVYIELDYKNNSTFIIGAYVNFSQSVIKKSIIAINPSEDWNKIYVNLTPTINESIGAQSLKVFISMLRPESMNSAELSIDNFKIIYQWKK